MAVVAASVVAAATVMAAATAVAAAATAAAAMAEAERETVPLAEAGAMTAMSDDDNDDADDDNDGYNDDGQQRWWRLPAPVPIKRLITRILTTTSEPFN